MATSGSNSRTASKSKTTSKPAPKAARKPSAPVAKKPAPRPKPTKSAPAKAAPKKPAPAKAAPKKPIPAPPAPAKRGSAAKLIDGGSDGGSANKALTRSELATFRRELDEKRQEVVRNAQKTVTDGIQLDAAELPDDMDLASSEYLQYFNLRLRGREKTYLEKIERALHRIEIGTFGLCEECGEPIGAERLKVRPEATLCIRCKEAQEREEQQFG